MTGTIITLNVRMSTDVTPSNIYRFLGSVQEGQGTICEDEADDLDESPEKMTGFKIARNEDSINGGMSQSAYCTYGFTHLTVILTF